MTPLPKRRHSTRRQGKRDAAIRTSLPGVQLCTNCGKVRMQHRACKFCGTYDGRVVVAQKEQTPKTSAK